MAQFAVRTAYSQSDSGRSQLCTGPKVYFVVTVVSPGASFCMLPVPLAIFELHQKVDVASKQIKLNEGFCCDVVGTWQ